MTDGQVVWIWVANVGLSALSNSRSLLGRMDHLQQTKGDIEGLVLRTANYPAGLAGHLPGLPGAYASLGHVFIEDRQSHVQQKTPDPGALVFTVLLGRARRAGVPRGTWTTSGPPRGRAPTSFSRSSARCRVF